jgi:hypothetical protein
MVGTSVPTMHRYESGWDRFRLDTLRRLAGALGASLEVRLVPSSPCAPARRLRKADLVRLISGLFWDRKLRVSDLDDHGSWVLARVLMFGSGEQVAGARAYFGDKAIRQAVRRREVDPRTRNYWSLILEAECTPES